MTQLILPAPLTKNNWGLCARKVTKTNFPITWRRFSGWRVILALPLNSQGGDVEVLVAVLCSSVQKKSSSFLRNAGNLCYLAHLDRSILFLPFISTLQFYRSSHRSVLFLSLPYTLVPSPHEFLIFPPRHACLVYKTDGQGNNRWALGSIRWRSLLFDTNDRMVNFHIYGTPEIPHYL